MSDDEREALLDNDELDQSNKAEAKVEIVIVNPDDRQLSCVPCSAPTRSEHIHNSLENNLMANAVFDGIAFFAPKAMQWFIDQIPGPLFVLFPLINAAIGAGGVSYVKTLAQFTCCRSPSDKEKLINSFPKPFQAKFRELEQLQEFKNDRAKLFASLDMVLIYSVIGYLTKYQANIMALIQPYLLPVATPFLVAGVCYAVGKAVYGCIDSCGDDEYEVRYSIDDIEAAMGELTAIKQHYDTTVANSDSENTSDIYYNPNALDMA